MNRGRKARWYVSSALARVAFCKTSATYRAGGTSGGFAAQWQTSWRMSASNAPPFWIREVNSELVIKAVTVGFSANENSFQKERPITAETLPNRFAKREAGLVNSTQGRFSITFASLPSAGALSKKRVPRYNSEWKSAAHFARPSMNLHRRNCHVPIRGLQGGEGCRHHAPGA